jgi:hypothetical protein
LLLVELFGFALILNVMGMWEYWGAEGLQKMTSQSLSQESPFPLLALPSAISLLGFNRSRSRRDVILGLRGIDVI